MVAKTNGYLNRRSPKTCDRLGLNATGPAHNTAPIQSIVMG